MRSFHFLATLGIMVWATNGNAQEPKAKPEKAEITKATYMVTGLH